MSLRRVHQLFIGLLLAWVVCTPPLSAAEPKTHQLEQHLLSWPVFEQPLEELLARWADVDDEWKQLDQHWATKQPSDPRYAVMRGILAESQGQLDTAGKHYASAAKSEWGAYHHARWLALMGDTKAAFSELEQVAANTEHLWIFKRTVRALGELLYLQQGPEAAEKLYAALWESRPGLPQRTILLEPLLSLRLELGKNTDWLGPLVPDQHNSINPKDDASLLHRFAEGYIRVDWLYGRMPRPSISLLLDGSRASVVTRLGMPFPQYYSLTATAGGEWNSFFISPINLFLSMSSEGDLTGKDIGDSMLEDRVLDWRRSKPALAPSTPGLLTVQAGVQRDTLREKPWLIDLLAYQYREPKQLAELHDILAQQVFADVHHPAWLYRSLLLRLKAGQTADALHADALALWHQVEARVAADDERWELYNDYPRGDKRPPLNYDHDARNSSWLNEQRGIKKPTAAVLWNLRGKAFVEAMKARFQVRLHARLLEQTNDDLLSSHTLTDSQPRVDDLTASNFPAWSPARLLVSLWQLRAKLGIGDTDLGKPGSRGDSVRDRAIDLVLRGSFDETAAFIQATPDLSQVPSRWLLTLHNALPQRAFAGKRMSRPDEVLRETVDQCNQRLEQTICSQHPHWIVAPIIYQVALPDQPSASEALRDELLATCSKLRSSEEKSAPAKPWYQQLAPELTDPMHAAIAAANAQQRLALTALPHPLWGLEWQPSITREVRLLSDNYQPPSAAPKPNPALESIFGNSALNDINTQLLYAYGADITRPQPLRVKDMEPYAARLPFVKEITGIWSAMGKTASTPATSPFEPKLTTEQMQGILNVLAKSSSTRAKIVLATLHRKHGDQAEALRLADELKATSSPANQLANIFRNPPKPRQQTTSAISRPSAPAAPTTNPAIEDAKNFIAEPQSQETSSDLNFRLGANPVKHRIIYDWLKTEIKPEPKYANHANLFAHLARALKLSPAEIIAAELLDKQLNPNDALKTLRLAGTKADKGDSDANDLYLEAVRQRYFDTHDFYIRRLLPKGESWPQRLSKAGRSAELAAALIQGLSKIQAGRATQEAGDILCDLVTSQDAAHGPPWLSQLIGQVSYSHPHLFLANWDKLIEHSSALRNQGKQVTATQLTRAALLGTWDSSKDSEFFGSSNTLGTAPIGVFNAKTAWGNEDEAKPDSPILELLQQATRGEDVPAFLREITSVARTHANDEQIVSCALVCQAMHGPLPADALQLADKLPALGRLQVAWRLCVFAPAGHYPIRDLAPMLLAGIEAMFHSNRYVRNGCRHQMLAKDLMPWLKQAATKEELRRLMPTLLEQAGDCWYDYFEALVALALDAEATDSLPAIAARWRADCMKHIQAGYFERWTPPTIATLSRVTMGIKGPSAREFAGLTYDVWHSHLKAFGAKEDPSVETVTHVAEALLAAGDSAQLEAFATSLAQMLQLGGDEALAPLLTRVRRGPSDVAKGEAANHSLPSPSLWLTGSKQLHWRLSPGDKSADHKATATRKYELKLFAGADEQTARLLATQAATADSGSSSISELPESGWLWGSLSEAATGHSLQGPLTPYSLRKPSIDTASLAATGSPLWSSSQIRIYGRPLSAPIPMPDGAVFLVTDAAKKQPSGETSKPPPTYASLALVAVDANQMPLGLWAINERIADRDGSLVTPDGCRLSLLSHTSFYSVQADAQQWRNREQPGRTIHSQTKAFVLTSWSSPDAPLPPVRVQAFAPAANKTSPLLSLGAELQPTTLADLGFTATYWHVPMTRPRAVFCGQGQLVVFDTSMEPWRELCRLRDSFINEGTAAYAVANDAVCLHQRVRPMYNEQGATRILRWSDPGKAKLSEQTVLSFNPIQILLSEQEDALICISSGNYVQHTYTWVSQDGTHMNAQFGAPVTPRLPLPEIAWWSDGGKFTVHDNRVLLHFQKTADSFVLLAQSIGEGSSEHAPPGSRFIPSLPIRWALKNARLLIGAATATGDLRSAHPLPIDCQSQPIWLGRPSDPVLLQTAKHELISVRPPLR